MHNYHLNYSNFWAFISSYYFSINLYQKFFVIPAIQYCYSTLQYSSSKENTQSQTQKYLERFNGDFNILTNDTPFRTLPYLFTYNNYFNTKHLPGDCDRVRLKALGKNRLRSQPFNETMVRVLQNQISDLNSEIDAKQKLLAVL